MAIFLLAVPKTRGLDAEARMKAAKMVLSESFDAYSELVGNHYESEPEIKHPGGASASILVWKRTAEQNSVQTKKDWWAFTAGKTHLKKFLRRSLVEAKP